MARFPKIDTPCPLDATAREVVQGQCHVCHHEVHSLDGLDEAARRALLASANGPVCVKYRVPAASRPTAGMGRMIAATLIGAGLAGAAHAGTPPEDAGAPPPTVGVPVASPLAPPAPPAMSPVAPADRIDLAEGEDFDVIIMGGVSTPGAAEWIDLVDNSGLPELPMVVRPADVG